MSTAATAAVADAVVPKKGKKKLIMIIAGVVLLLVVAAVVAVVLMKKKSAAADGDDADAAPAQAVQAESKEKPTFVPLDPFTVNLADHDSERYAQVGITLQVSDEKVGEQIKTYMPAIRNNILLALSDRTAAQLMARDGKADLAQQIIRETSKAMGYEVEPAKAKASSDDSSSDDNSDDNDKPKKRKKSHAKSPELPVKAVQFSNFIIQ